MKKSRLFLGVLTLLFIIIVTFSVFTLSVNALDQNPEEENGKWAAVCCGPTCQTGQDFCIGTGTYKCCK